MMRSLFKEVCLVVCFVLLFSTTAYADLALKFGLYATDRPSELIRRFHPLISAIETNLTARLDQPVTIDMVIAKSYSEGVNNIVTGKVDFSRLGPASYVNLMDKNPLASLIAMESKQSGKVFHGVVVVNKTSSIKSLLDLKGKRFAFGNKESTIGRYLVQSELMNVGIYAKDLSFFQYLGRHDKVGTAVAVGAYDAGALKESTFKKLQNNGKGLRVIHRFNNVTKPWVARSNLPEQVVQSLQQVLLGLDDAKALAAIQQSFFVTSTEEDFASIKKAMHENSRFITASD